MATLDYGKRPDRVRRWRRWVILGVLAIVAAAMTPTIMRRADGWLLRRRLATWEARQARVEAITAQIPRQGHEPSDAADAKDAAALRVLWLQIADAIDAPLRERAAASQRLGRFDFPVQATFMNVGGHHADDLYLGYVDAGGTEPLPPLIGVTGRDAVLLPLLNDPAGRERDAMNVGGLLAWAPPADPSALRQMAEAWLIAGPKTRTAYVAAAEGAMLDYPAEAAEVFRLALEDSHSAERPDGVMAVFAAEFAMHRRRQEPWAKGARPFHDVLIALLESGEGETPANQMGADVLEELLNDGVTLPGPPVADAAIARARKRRAYSIAYIGRLIVRLPDVRPNQLAALRQITAAELDRLAAIPPAERLEHEADFSPTILGELLSFVDARLAGNPPDPRLIGSQRREPGEVRTTLGLLVGYDPAGLGVPAWDQGQ